MARKSAAELADQEFVEKQKEAIVTYAPTDGGSDSEGYNGPEEGYVVFKLIDNKRNGRVWLDGKEKVWNPKIQREEFMYLIPGANSIWASELDKETIKLKTESLMFEDRKMVIPKWDKNKIEFARASKHLVSDKKKRIGTKFEYIEWDPEAQQRKHYETRILKLEMITVASQRPEEKMRRHAFFLGIPMADMMGFPKTEKGLRTDYMLYAEENPQTFNETLESKDVDVKYMVQRAILDATIDLGNGDGRVKWAKTGGFIAVVPKGFDAVKYLMDLALTNSEEGKTFLQQLQNIVK